MSDTDTRATFITAALVLLVMPIVYAIGLASTMLVLRLTPWRDARGVMLAFAVIWGLIVLTGVLIVARRLNRHSTGA